MTTEQKTQLTTAFDTYYNAHLNLLDLWQEHANGLLCTDYPKYLPSFDEHLAEIAEWINSSKQEIDHLTLNTNGFIVLSVLMGSYQPTFHEDEKLMFFSTEKEAQTAIDECIADVKQAVIDRNMLYEYSQDDYKIIPAFLDGETITCIVDDERYTMQRSDDDFVKVAHPLAQ